VATAVLNKQEHRHCRRRSTTLRADLQAQPGGAGLYRSHGQDRARALFDAGAITIEEEGPPTVKAWIKARSL